MLRRKRNPEPESTTPLQPDSPLPGVLMGWVPDVAAGSELGEHEALEALHLARRTFERASKAARDSVRLESDAKDALVTAKALVRRIAERPA